MSDAKQPRAARPPADSRAPSPARRVPTRQSIDCGSAARETETIRRRDPVANDSRLGYLTASGCYADQVQAI